MILAAGLGRRLQPITDTVPKALVPVGGRPLLEHAILRLKAAGFSHIAVNIHHHGDQITDFLAANNNFGVTIWISDERDYLCDTGGGIKLACRFLDGAEPFLVHNVDILSNVDLQALCKAHAPDSLATLLVSQRDSSRQLLFNRDQRLCGWRNKDTGNIKSFYPGFDPSKHIEYAFSGIHVISPSIFGWMEDWTGKFSIIDFYLSAAPKTTICAYTENHIEVLDVGSPERLEQAEKWIRKTATRDVGYQPG